MNNVYFLSILNYAPLYACLFGILLLGFGLVRRNVSLIQAGLTTLLVGAGLAMYLMSTASGLPMLNAGFLGDQAQWQNWGLWVMGGTALASLLGLLTTSSRPARARRPKVWAVVALVLSLGSFGMLVKGSLFTQVQSPPEAQIHQPEAPSITAK